jgi:hypothetical protein
MAESLLDFSKPNIHRIGIPSYDYSTFILLRKSTQIVRKYNAIGISVSILQDLLKRHCQLIVIKLDGIARYKISPDDWLHKSIIDQLTPRQEPHAFIPIPSLRRFE